MSLMLSMVTLHASNVPDGIPHDASVKPFEGIDLGAMTADADTKAFLDAVSSMTNFTGITSLLAALLFIATGILLLLRRNVLVTTGMTVGAVYMCVAARIPAGIITGLAERVTSSLTQMLGVAAFDDDDSGEITEFSQILSSISIKNGAGTNFIIVSEILAVVALIVIAAWIIIHGTKTMKGAIR
ncbi:hypothetical protein [Cutibacterium sp. V947]|uniref:hypothetical protein n=1 Tax=unclassified Cutibacterium TaxID=2649671 RepID=UPI003EE14143